MPYKDNIGLESYTYTCNKTRMDGKPKVTRSTESKALRNDQFTKTSYMLSKRNI